MVPDICGAVNCPGAARVQCGVVGSGFCGAGVTDSSGGLGRGYCEGLLVSWLCDAELVGAVWELVDRLDLVGRLELMAARLDLVGGGLKN